MNQIQKTSTPPEVSNSAVTIEAEHYNAGAKILASVKDVLYWVFDMRNHMFSITAIGKFSAVQVKFMRAEIPEAKKFLGIVTDEFRSVILGKVSKGNTIRFTQLSDKAYLLLGESSNNSILIMTETGSFIGGNCRFTKCYENLLGSGQVSNVSFFDLCDTESLEVGASSSKKVATLSLSRNGENSGLVLGRECIKSQKRITLNMQLLKPLFVNPFEDDGAPEIFASESYSSGTPIRFQRHFSGKGLIVDIIVMPITTIDMGSSSPDIPFSEVDDDEQ